MTTTTMQNTPAKLAERLTADGYTVTEVPESYEDCGDPENGPDLCGGPAYDEWRNGTHVIIVIDGAVVEQFHEQPVPDLFPF